MKNITSLKKSLNFGTANNIFKLKHMANLMND